MNDLGSWIFDRIRAKIEGWEEATRNEIYGLSFYIECEEDDLRKPRLAFGYNTESHYAQSVDEASDAGEARWNYAFWLQNEEIVIGDDYVVEGRMEQQYRDEWVKSLPWFYTDDEEDAEFERTLKLGDQIVEAFNEIIYLVVNRLRDEAVIEKAFGRPIPLLVHGLEYSDETAEVNRKLNPDGAAEKFAAWIESM